MQQKNLTKWTADKEKKTVRVGFVGGGNGAYELLKLFSTYQPKHLQISIVGVADPSPEALGRCYAEQHAIPVFDDWHAFHSLDVDILIELTGSDEVLEKIYSQKSASTKVLDHLSALFLWEVIAVQEEKLHLEQRVATLDTMTAVGEMSYHLMHRLRNPLMIAGGMVRKIMTRVDLPHGARKRLKQVARSVQDMEEVVSDICDVIRPLKPFFVAVDLNLFFREFCRAAALEARFVRAEFSFVVEEDLPEIFLDPSLFRQALWHVLENCFDAAKGEKAIIYFRVKLCYDYILIQIRDEGNGFVAISPEAALNPFVSTHSGRMGLGLTLCRQIMLEHGGDIDLGNVPGKGATALLRLPVMFKPPARVK